MTKKTLTKANKKPPKKKAYKVTKEKLVRAINNSYGVLNTIAERLGSNRVSIWEFLNKHPELRILIEAEKEKIIDVAEKELFTLIKCGDMKAIDRLLKTRGRSRGYGDHLQQDSNIQAEITTHLSKDEKKDLLRELTNVSNAED